MTNSEVARPNAWASPPAIFVLATIEDLARKPVVVRPAAGITPLRHLRLAAVSR